MDTATDWLMSIGPVLAGFKAEDEAEAAIFGPPTDAWLEAECCEGCGGYFRLDQMGIRYLCKACYAPVFAESVDGALQEERGRREMVRRAG